jgi:hypothetical protein
VTVARKQAGIITTTVYRIGEAGVEVSFMHSPFAKVSGGYLNQRASQPRNFA